MRSPASRSIARILFASSLLSATLTALQSIILAGAPDAAAILPGLRPSIFAEVILALAALAGGLRLTFQCATPRPQAVILEPHIKTP